MCEKIKKSGIYTVPGKGLQSASSSGSVAETQNSESGVHKWCAAKYVMLTGKLTQAKVTLVYPTICANMLRQEQHQANNVTCLLFNLDCI
jgi:hypothetical protein